MQALQEVYAWAYIGTYLSCGSLDSFRNCDSSLTDPLVSTAMGWNKYIGLVKVGIFPGLLLLGNGGCSTSLLSRGTYSGLAGVNTGDVPHQ